MLLLIMPRNFLEQVEGVVDNLRAGCKKNNFEEKIIENSAIYTSERRGQLREEFKNGLSILVKLTKLKVKEQQGHGIEVMRHDAKEYQDNVLSSRQ
ncbi:hypothetical protein KQX54_007830 [Cotesia glomerata]|uniref:Uncharacterized protein n=1 Tax=Cotesia glomerata TaxID=32391 RepID=A0AAV7HSS2_COTGL|nr:hypothetical protein KQX54_007830 [Cotesia glomerata]